MVVWRKFSYVRCKILRLRRLRLRSGNSHFCICYSRDLACDVGTIPHSGHRSAWRAGRSRILCSAGCVPASAEVARCSKRTLERSRMPWLGASSGPRNSTSCSRAARRFDYAGVSPNTPASLVKSTLPTIPARKAHTRPSPTGHNTSNARRASLCRRTQGTASRPRQRCQLIVNAIRLIPTRIRANKCADTGSMLRR